MQHVQVLTRFRVKNHM